MKQVAFQYDPVTLIDPTDEERKELATRAAKTAAVYVDALMVELMAVGFVPDFAEMTRIAGEVFTAARAHESALFIERHLKQQGDQGVS